MKKHVEETVGVTIAKRLLASKQQTQKEALIEFKTNSAVQQAVQQLIKRNEQRGTPIIVTPL